jgi:hypothetical protein
MIKRITLLSTAFLFICSIAFGSQVDSLMNVLDQEIIQSKKYQEAREMRIESLKKLYESSASIPDQSYLIISKLYEEYRAYNFDSALHYIDLKIEIAQRLNQLEPLWESKLQLSDILSATGMYKEAQEVLNRIDRTKLTENLLSKYYNSQWLLNDQIWHATRKSDQLPDFEKISFAYKDSLLKTLDPVSFDYKRAKEMQLYEMRDIKGSRAIIAQLLSGMHEGTQEHAVFSYWMAMTYRAEKNLEQEKKYLILSALSDIRYAVKDNASLTLLAMRLFEEKKIDKAYDYIQFSLNDAVFFNAPLRFVEISRILPVINEAYQFKSERQKNLLRTYLFLISFLTIFLILSLVFIFKQMKKLAFARTDLENANLQLNTLNNDLSSMNSRLNELNQDLVESDHVKELYIGHFLSRCSGYIDKLDNYQKMVNKYITARKINELFENTKSSQLIEKELEEFYTSFDTTFLTIYPDFVSQLNSLLNEDDHIVLKKGELLNTELRIFALIRLGVTDSSKIASLLRYSVNTIYNYRVKIKNKSSVPRDDFETMVMKIGTFSKRL